MKRKIKKRGNAIVKKELFSWDKSESIGKKENVERLKWDENEKKKDTRIEIDM